MLITRKRRNRLPCFQLMRNVYRWMTFALAITGLTAACVAGNATLMQFILGNQAVFLGLIIAELVVAFT
mgnify:CR=1 FL=1